ncbi:hypothetical protein ABZ567_19320 [Streptomyces sp. NPDC016459]|uniref:hypothetical protein n=1 Tax=Streptomyces sp. NPDC016459 TaxID=3157190 RepID=UPI0033E5C968
MDQSRVPVPGTRRRSDGVHGPSLPGGGSGDGALAPDAAGAALLTLRVVTSQGPIG